MPEQRNEISTERTATGQRTTQTTSVNPAPAEQEEARATQNVSKANYWVYYVLGALEILLAFRLILKITGANPSSGFVNFIYAFSGIFVAPFTGIFHVATTQGNVTTAIFEPATLVAMVVYLILFYGIAKIIESITAGK